MLGYKSSQRISFERIRFIDKFNEQYGDLVVSFSSKFHDRFLIIDDKELFLIGASIKDLGKKCFAFTKLDSREIDGLKERI